MRDFTHVQQNLGLKKFLASVLGTLYYVPSAPGPARIMVRHFDRDVPPARIEAYVDLVRSIQGWIADHAELERLIRVEQPLEVRNGFRGAPTSHLCTLR